VTNAWLEVALGGEKTFNVIRAEEMILLGQRIAKYQVEALASGGAWRGNDGLHGITLDPGEIFRCLAQPPLKEAEPVVISAH